MQTSDKTGCVYVHICPNGKLYIGITSQSFSARCGRNGMGYKNQKLFWRAIQKYGWDNIQHIVLISDIPYELAKLVEKNLISKYQTSNANFGYNETLGGDGVCGYKYTDEQLKNHKSFLGKHHSEENKKRWSEMRKGKPMSLEQRQLLSQIKKGKQSPNKGKHLNLSEESRKKISERSLGVARHTKPHSDETKKKLSELAKGRVISDATREKLRQRALEQWKRQKSLNVKED